MKAFTYSQKKWAMTTALLVALGFNISFNLYSGGTSSMDLAATSPEGANKKEASKDAKPEEAAKAKDAKPAEPAKKEDSAPSKDKKETPADGKSATASEDKKSTAFEGKISTAAGNAKVTYIQSDKDVFAIVPTMTEGSFCDHCGSELYTLSGANTSNLDKLNIALSEIVNDKVKAGKEKKDEKVVAKASDEKPEEKTKEEIEAEKKAKAAEALTAKTKAKIDSIKSLCADSDGKLDCYSSKLLELVKDEKLDKKVIAEFTKDSIVRQAQNDVSLAQRGISARLKVQSAYSLGVYDVSSGQEFQKIYDKVGDPTEVRSATLESISSLIEGLPSAYEDARKALLNGERAIVQNEANQIQSARIAAAANPNGPSLQNDVLGRSLALPGLQSGLKFYGLNAVNGAEASGYITDSLARQYTDILNQIGNPLFTTSGTIITNQSGLEARLLGGRGIVRPTTAGGVLSAIPSLNGIQQTLPGVAIPATVPAVNSIGPVTTPQYIQLNQLNTIPSNNLLAPRAAGRL